MSLRRFGTRPGRDLLERLADKTARTGKAFEINARYHDDPWDLVELCRQAGCLISLGSNAHARAEVGTITRLLQRPPTS